MYISKILKKIYDDISKAEYRGLVADYIPELKNADINSLAIVLIDEDKNIYKAGDTEIKFSIQSISKIFSLAMAIKDRGIENVLEKVSFNGTEDMFNTYKNLEIPNYIPANPMINAGAITTTSMVDGVQIDRMLEFIGANLKEKIDYNKDIYVSERDTGDRNKALAYLLKSKALLGDDFLDILDNYFKQCSIELTTVQLAKLGYIFANEGVNYFGEVALEKDLVRQVNSIMSVAGMYNYSGEYAMRVGIPSKSGVGGGILGVVPKKYSIAVYSPGLDENGNSVLGQMVMERLSKELDCSIF